MGGMVTVGILHDSGHAVLVDCAGRQKWLPREAVKHYIGADGILNLPANLAAKLDFDVARHRPAYDLDFLTEELTLRGKDVIPYKPNRPPQQAAFDKLHRLSRFALFMQMRAGKSKVAIDIVCNHYANGHIDRVWWLCPNSATATAEAQWQKFAVIDVPLQINALETVSGCGSRRLLQMTKWFTPRCAIIIDESQMVKNGRAKRCRRLQNLFKQAAVVGILSGTPITQNIQDLYNQVRILDWRIFGYRNIWQFRASHLVMSEKYPGLIHDTKNTEYLSERLQPFVYEWFGRYDEGKITRNNIWLDVSKEQRRLYESIKTEILTRLRNYTERHGDIYLLFTALQSVLCGYVSERTMRRVFLNDKLQAVTLQHPKQDRLLAYLADTCGQKIVWCTRRFELYRLAECLPNAFIVSGDMNADKRHQCITAFRHSKNGILLAMVQVAKRAIEMSECNNVIYYSHSFDFESREQSKWRTLLPEKTDTVHYTDMIYEHSLDERMLEAHTKKRQVVREFLDLLKTDRTAAIKQLEKL